MAREVGGERGAVALAEPGAVGVAGEGHGARPAGGVAPLSAGVRSARWGYLALAWVFAGCVAAQVFLAGMAIFVDSARWGWHTSFIHAFEGLPLVMLVAAFLGRLPAALRWLTGALIALIWAQYATANIGGLPEAFHPVSGFVIFWIAVHLGQRAWRVVRAEGRGAGVAA